MRTNFDIGAGSYASLATLAEADNWVVIDRQFPGTPNDDAKMLALARASAWLSSRASVPLDVDEQTVRATVRIATYFADNGTLTPLAPSASVVSNAGVTVDQRFSGQQDRDAASRLGFPDIESYVLVKHLFAPSRVGLSIDFPTGYQDLGL